MSFSRKRESKIKYMPGSNTAWNILTRNHKVEIFNSEMNYKWNSPWYFIQGADSQYGFIERCLNKKKIPRWEREIDLTKTLVEKINALNPRPKFFAICGDMCDAIPCEDSDTFKLQEATFKNIFGKVDPSIPLLVTCGNRDFGDVATREAVDTFRSSWGDDFYSFWCGGIFFITINTQYYMNPSSDPKLVEEQDRWLEKQLRIGKENDSRIIMFQHVPWFIKTADEPENKIFTIRKEIRNKMLDKLVEAGVQIVFCGHYHRNAGGQYRNLEVVVTSAIGGQLGTDISGARIVKVYETKIEHSYCGIEELPTTVKL